MPENTTFIPKTFIRVERGDRISWLDEIGAYLHNKTSGACSLVTLPALVPFEAAQGASAITLSSAKHIWGASPIAEICSLVGLLV